MINGEKYKSEAERKTAFDEFCETRKSCEDCPIYDTIDYTEDCILEWLYLEEEEKLKPCSFCGGAVKMTYEHNYLCNNYIFSCTECDAKVEFTDRPRAREEAIEKWNRRADNG